MSAAQKSKKRRRWLAILFYSFVFLTLVGLAFWGFVVHKTRSVLLNAGYLEKWEEGVDGTTLLDVPYGDEEWEKIDVYFPNAERRVPARGAIVYIHGGAWTIGDRGEMRAFARRAAKNGYLSASIGYMLYGDSTKSRYSIAAILDEIGSALKKLREVATENGYRLDCVALVGDSAGGHLLSLYAYSRGKTAEVPVAFIAPRVSPIDFRADSWESVQTPQTVALIASAMTGKQLDEKDVSEPEGDALKAIDSISPLALLTRESAVPTLASYGGKDPIVGTRHGRKLVEAFQTLGAKGVENATNEDEIVFDYLEFPRSGHLLSSDPDRAVERTRLFKKYLARYLDEPTESQEEDADAEENADAESESAPE